MGKEFICGGEKYYGFTGVSVAMPIPIPDLAPFIEVEGERLSVRSSFHVTLLSVKKIIPKYRIGISNFSDRVVEDFCEFVRGNAIEFVRYGDEFRFVSEEEKKSVIVMCEVSNLENFFDFINKKYQLAILYQPTHITLYTLQPDAGIFLADADDLKNLTKVISKPKDITLVLN